MAASLTQICASLRAASQSLSLHSTSNLVRSLPARAATHQLRQDRFFSSRSASQAPTKGKQQKKPTLKKKSVLRKNAPSGPRSVSARRKAEGGAQQTGGLSKTSPFYNEPDLASHLEPLSLSSLVPETVGNVLAVPPQLAQQLKQSQLLGLRGKNVRAHIVEHNG